MYSVGRTQTWHTGCATLVLLEDGMEVSYKKLNTQWPIWEIIATAAAGQGGNEEKYEGIFLGQNRKYLLHQYASLCTTNGSYSCVSSQNTLEKKIYEDIGC